MSAAKTKTIRINLSALTMATYSEVVQVPEDASAEDIQKIIDQRYEEVDAGSYIGENTYWKRGDCGYDVCDDDEAPSIDELQHENSITPHPSRTNILNRQEQEKYKTLIELEFSFKRGEKGWVFQQPGQEVWSRPWFYLSDAVTSAWGHASEPVLKNTFLMIPWAAMPLEAQIVIIKENWLAKYNQEFSQPPGLNM